MFLVYNKCLAMRGRRRQQYVLVLQTFPYGLAFLLQKFPRAGRHGRARVKCRVFDSDAERFGGEIHFT